MNDENGKVKIEKGIPLPERRTGSPKYPWKEMEVGDSFLIAKNLGGNITLHNRDGKRFVSRAETDTHRRVWRVA